MENVRPLFFTVSPVIIMELVRNLKCIVYACITFLEAKQFMAAEKMRWKSHCVYPP